MGKQALWTGIIYGQPITKKNSQRIVTNPKTKRFMIMPSKQYKDYEAVALRNIDIPDTPICEQVNVKCIYYMQTHRPCDLTNLMEATHDILVKAKVLDDDNNNIIVAVDGSRVAYDKENPRVEICIEEMQQ